MDTNPSIMAGGLLNPNRLVEEKRKKVLRLYFNGVIDWRDAARAIGVSLSTMKRLTPKGFDWSEAHARFVDREVDRVIAPKVRLTVRQKGDLKAE